MAAFRIVDQFPVYQDAQGNPVAGGYLAFYETGTTTPANVYGNKALTVNNGPTVALDSSGRTNVDVWGDGTPLRVRLYSADDVLIDEADNVELPGGAAESLPAFQTGKFLTNDGAVLSWADVVQVPDPTGQANKILGTDGTVTMWVTRPADGTTPTTEPLPVGGVVQTTTSLRAGKWMQQVGTGSAPASGGRTTSVAITFATAMATGLHVSVMPSIATITGVGYAPVWAVTNLTGTGCTVNFDVNADAAGANISSAVTFSYLATGLMA